MAAPSQMLYSAGRNIQTTWSTTDKAASCTLSNANRTATFTTTAAIVRNTLVKTAGRGYAEITLTANTKGYIGVATASANLNSYPGSDAYGWAFTQDGLSVHNGGVVPDGSGYTTNNVIGLAVDVDAGAMSMYVNGVYQTGTTGLTGSLFLAVGVNATTGASAYLLNAGATAFTYGPPAGYPPGWF